MILNWMSNEMVCICISSTRSRMRHCRCAHFNIPAEKWNVADKRAARSEQRDQKSHTVESTSPLQVWQRSQSISKGAALVY